MRARGEREVTRIAELQRAMIHRRQLQAAGVGRGGLAYRRRAGTLHQVHQDVFLVGRRRVEPLGLETAAVLQWAGYAVLADASAALLWGIAQPSDPRHVTIALIGRDSKSKPGLTIRRLLGLDPQDMRCRHGLPVTSPARTFIDRAATVSPLELENDLIELRRRHRLRDREVEDALDRVPANRKGIAVVRALLGAPDDLRATRSLYERRLLRIIAAANLPMPATNVRICGHLVDAVWRQQRLVVEVDSWRFHSGRGAFETDRAWLLDLVAAGFRVIRVTARQIDHQPLAVAAGIAQALVQRF